MSRKLTDLIRVHRRAHRFRSQAPSYQVSWSHPNAEPLRIQILRDIVAHGTPSGCVRTHEQSHLRIVHSAPVRRPNARIVQPTGLPPTEAA